MSADEWRASQIATRMSSLTWWEVLAAALYDVGSPTDVAHLQHHPFVQTKVDANNRTTNIKQTLWSALQLHTVESSTTVKHKNRQSPGVFDKSADSKWNLSGDWKDGCADINGMNFKTEVHNRQQVAY
jgi:5-methylcytosine-specific restriction protein B